MRGSHIRNIVAAAALSVALSASGCGSLFYVHTQGDTDHLCDRVRQFHDGLRIEHSHLVATDRANYWRLWLPGPRGAAARCALLREQKAVAPTQ